MCQLRTCVSNVSGIVQRKFGNGLCVCTENMLLKHAHIHAGMQPYFKVQFSVYISQDCIDTKHWA